MSPQNHYVSASAVTERASQFDLLLVAIPLVLAVGFGSGVVLSVPLFVGAVAGALVASGLVGYGVYTLA